MRTMKLASEKSFNRGICLVKNVKNNPIKYPFAVNYKKFVFACGKGILSAKHLMIMDIIGTSLIHAAYGNKSFSDRIPLPSEIKVKKISGIYMSQKLLEYISKKLSPNDNGIIPESWYSDDGRLYIIDKEKQRIKKPRTIILNDGALRRQLTCLHKYSSLEIMKMIKQTSELVLWMNFPIRYYNGKKYKTFPFNNYGFQSNLFTLKEIKVSKISKDDHVLEREYVIQLDTILGYVFTQNAASCYVDFLPDRFYDLSEYAQLFYRLFILTYYPSRKNGKSPYNPVSLSCIEKRLVLRSKNKTMNRNVVKRILKELEDNNFINNPKEMKLFGGDYIYSFKKNDWKDISVKNGSIKDDLNTHDHI